MTKFQTLKQTAMSIFNYMVFGCFEHLTIRILILFRISVFEFRIFTAKLAGNIFQGIPISHLLIFNGA
jgi:hypothetical protein